MHFSDLPMSTLRFWSASIPVRMPPDNFKNLSLCTISYSKQHKYCFFCNVHQSSIVNAVVSVANASLSDRIDQHLSR